MITQQQRRHAPLSPARIAFVLELERRRVERELRTPRRGNPAGR